MEKVLAHLQQEPFITHISASGHKFVADEPLDIGGKDAGPTPNELLCSALAACTAITLKMYANRKNWDLQEVKVEVTFEKGSAPSASKMIRTIELIGALDPEQKERLLQIACQCPVHKTLSNPIEINSTLNEISGSTY
jgi:putative redox protein